jgi:glutamate dehydrogenase
MFALPRSSWDDYDKKLIGKGGGVFARTKEIPLTPEVQALIGSDEKLVARRADQRAAQGQIDLLWFGGIGTYIKAAGQSQPGSRRPRQ